MQSDHTERAPEDGELVRADLKALVISTLALIATVAGGFALIMHNIRIGEYAIESAHFGRDEAIVQLAGLMRISAGIAALASVPAGLYMIWVAALTWRSGVYPPGGVRLPVSVIARRGSMARTKAARLALLSALLVALAAANYMIVPRMILGAFAPGALRP